jgi:hypothetical protein
MRIIAWLKVKSKSLSLPQINTRFIVGWMVVSSKDCR